MKGGTRQPLTLRKAKMISYSQLYAEEKPSVDSLVRDIPTADAVEWCSYIVFRKDNLKIGETDIHILTPLLFSFESELQHKIGTVGKCREFLNKLIDNVMEFSYI